MFEIYVAFTVPFHVTRKIIMSLYWLKILNMNETPLPKLKDDVDNGITDAGLKWVSI